MKIMQWMVGAAAVFLLGGTVFAEDVDLKAIQERLAVQEAHFSELEAKVRAGRGYGNYNGNPEAIVSLDKNAMVTVGGNLNSRYFYHSGKLDSVYVNPDVSVLDTGTNAPVITEQPSGLAPAPGPNGGWGVVQNDAGPANAVYSRRAKASQGDLLISDAKVYVDVQVNDHVDAFVQMDLQSSDDLASDNAERYFLRWKNICNSGFGIKVGRDALVFGTDFSEGQLGDYTADGDGLGDIYWGSYFDGGLGAFVNPDAPNWAEAGYGTRIGHYGGVLPRHSIWDIGRITQINPYWEFWDGKAMLEASVFMNNDKSGRLSKTVADVDQIYVDGSKYRSRNYGFGSASLRGTVTPIEGLEISASVVNFHDRGLDKNSSLMNRDPGFADGFSKNSTSTALAFSYRPAFFPSLRTWAQWIHGWNVDGLKDVDSDAISYGVAFDFAENWTIFAQGDWLSTKDKHRMKIYDPMAGYTLNDFANNDKATAWAAYGGVKYAFGFGVELEAGWKHEEVKWRQNVDTVNGTWQRVAGRSRTLKAKSDTAYVHLGFVF